MQPDTEQQTEATSEQQTVHNRSAEMRAEVEEDEINAEDEDEINAAMEKQDTACTAAPEDDEINAAPTNNAVEEEEDAALQERLNLETASAEYTLENDMILDGE